MYQLEYYPGLITRRFILHGLRTIDSLFWISGKSVYKRIKAPRLLIWKTMYAPLPPCGKVHPRRVISVG